jgi:quercetin 2,3-dioxygenase
MGRLTRREVLIGGAAAASVGMLRGCAVPARRHDADLREVASVVAAAPGRDGAGVNLRRSLGGRALPLLDPFLLLDEIHSDRPEDWMAGFPDHPHRGFETVSYVIAGAFVHRDSVGNHGRIADGGTQWMTAGHGIVHSEMPRQDAGLDLWGLQLWVNLPAKLKMTPPRYQDLGAAAIPEVDAGDGRARIVAGRLGKQRGPVDGIVVSPTMIDMTLPAGGRLRHELPADQTAFVYVLEGEARLGAKGTSVAAGNLAVLGAGREVEAKTAAGARFLLLAAAPIGEPVARRGPFVMNTEAELDQAVADYRSGRLVAP